MSSPFEVRDQRQETRRCNGCGGEFTATILVTRLGEFGGGGLCEPCEIAADEKRQAEKLENDRIDRMVQSGMPKALRNIGLDGFDPELVAVAQEWAAKGGGLCLTGPVGVGKTRLAAAACNLRFNRAGIRWISVARLMAQLRSGFGDDARAEASRIIAGTGAAVLDDLDKVNPSDYGREVLFAAIDGRVEAGSALIVTTNLPPSQIGETLGDAIMSRLVGYCDVVQMAGRDRRLDR